MGQQVTFSENTIDGIMSKAKLETPNHSGWVNDIHCPNHDDKTPSAGYNVQSQILHCFTCDKSWFIGELRGITEKDKMEFLLKRIEAIQESILADAEFSIDYSKGEIPQYALDRGFSDEDLRAFDCGSDGYGNLVIPIKNYEGKVVGSIRRFTSNNSVRRYLYSPKKLQIGKQLFGIDRLYHKCVDTLYVTEGSLDAIWLWKFGYPAVALLGRHIGNYKERLIKQITFRQLVFIMDNNAPSLELYHEMIRRFKGFQTRMGYVNPPLKYDDIQDVRDEGKLRNYMEDVTWENQFRA